MSVNLKVPKETPGEGTRSLAGAGLPTIRQGKVKITKRKKSPKLKGGADDVSSNRTGGLGPSNPRAKSRSPNPSFNSVLSRVKDWEIGQFTPKTALRDNVEQMFNKSNQPFSNSSVDSLLDGKNRNASFNENNEELNKSDFEPWKPSPTGSPDPMTDLVGNLGLETSGSALGIVQGGAGASGTKATTSVLLKSTLSSNIGKECSIHFWYIITLEFTFEPRIISAHTV